MNTIARGNAAEAAVLHGLVEGGVPVLVPFGGGGAFDLAAVLPDDSVVRIQVKSGRVRGGCVLFNTASTDHGRGRIDYRGRAELLAVHVAEIAGIFIIPVEECPSFVGSLRLDPPRNNQQRGIRMAEDYALEAWLEAQWAAVVTSAAA